MCCRKFYSRIKVIIFELIKNCLLEFETLPPIELFGDNSTRNDLESIRHH